MGLKALDKSYENFNVGDIVVKNVQYGSVYGVKIVKKVFLDATGEYHFIVAEGDVSGNEWVNAKIGGQHQLSILTVKQLRAYDSKWTPGEVFKPGQVLKDQDGTIYIVASSTNVWNTKRGTKTTQARWEAPGTDWGNRKFTVVKTASGHDFSSAIEVKDVWENRF